MTSELTEASRLPEVPEELTADWLSDALGWSIRAVDRQVLGKGAGFLGDIVRLQLTSDDPAAPRTVIAKLPKKANRSTGEMLGVYEREILFFQDLAPKVPARTPRVYYSYFDRDAGSEKQKQILKAFDGLPGFLTPLVTLLGAKIAAGKKRKYLLIMEDLGDLEVGDQWVGATVDQCATVLAQIAGTHRQFWNAPELAERFWLLPMDIDARMRHRMFKKSLSGFRDIAKDEMKPYLDWVERHGADLMAAFTRDAPHTLVHCDLRLDNVCFEPDGCAYLDWQLTRVGPAAYDIAYFLGGALSPDVTSSEEQQLLHHYHRALDVPDYSFASFLRDYQRALMLTVTSLAPTEDIEIDQGRGQEMMERWRARLAARLKHVDIKTLL